MEASPILKVVTIPMIQNNYGYLGKHRAVSMCDWCDTRLLACQSSTLRQKRRVWWTLWSLPQSRRLSRKRAFLLNAY